MMTNFKGHKGKGFILCLVLIILNFNMICAYADTVTLPVYMEIAAMTMEFEITESIGMQCTEGSNELIIDDLVVTNTSVDPLDIQLTNMVIRPQGAWKLVADTADFSDMVDVKCFSFVAGGQDFYTENFSKKLTIPSGESGTVSFSGHTGYFNEAVSEKAADLVVTIEKAPRISGFEIKLDKLEDGRNWTAFEVEEGMTWGEWVESDYNTEGFTLCKNGGCHIVHPKNYMIFDDEGMYLVKKDALIVVGYRYRLSQSYE